MLCPSVSLIWSAEWCLVRHTWHKAPLYVVLSNLLLTRPSYVPKFEASTEASVQIHVLWDVMLCGRVALEN